MRGKGTESEERTWKDGERGKKKLKGPEWGGGKRRNEKQQRLVLN